MPFLEFRASLRVQAQFMCSTIEGPKLGASIMRWGDTAFGLLHSVFELYSAKALQAVKP